MRTLNESDSVCESDCERVIGTDRVRVFGRVITREEDAETERTCEKLIEGAEDSVGD